MIGSQRPISENESMSPGPRPISVSSMLIERSHHTQQSMRVGTFFIDSSSVGVWYELRCRFQAFRVQVFGKEVVALCPPLSAPVQFATRQRVLKNQIMAIKSAEFNTVLKTMCPMK